MTDRHYALFANNQHPMQLDIYNSYNKMLRQLNDEGHVARVAETEARIEEIVQERTKYLNASEGESLSTDDM